jgi:hypothetical protein
MLPITPAIDLCVSAKIDQYGTTMKQMAGGSAIAVPAVAPSSDEMMTQPSICFLWSLFPQTESSPA